MKRKLQIISLVLGAAILVYMGFLAVDAVRLWKETPKSTTPSVPWGYDRRYSGDYPENYSAIEITDSAGDYVSGIVIDLWYAANGVYNVDDNIMFEPGEPAKLFEAAPEYLELKNYDAVIDRVFTANGRKQVEETSLAGGPAVIQKADGKVYRLGPWRTGNNYAWAMVDMQTKEVAEDKLVITVKHEASGILFRDELPPDYLPAYAFTDFTIVKQGNSWLVDDYVYPEADKID